MNYGAGNVVRKDCHSALGAVVSIKCMKILRDMYSPLQAVGSGGLGFPCPSLELCYTGDGEIAWRVLFSKSNLLITIKPDLSIYSTFSPCSMDGLSTLFSVEALL